jgi:hypothetical protein
MSYKNNYNNNTNTCNMIFPTSILLIHILDYLLINVSFSCSSFQSVLNNCVWFSVRSLGSLSGCKKNLTFFEAGSWDNIEYGNRRANRNYNMRQLSSFTTHGQRN